MMTPNQQAFLDALKLELKQFSSEEILDILAPLLAATVKATGTDSGKNWGRVLVNLFQAEPHRVELLSMATVITVCHKSGIQVSDWSPQISTTAENLEATILAQVQKDQVKH